MAHTIMAVQSNFFISCDNNLIAKARACYSHLKLPVKVLTPIEFIKTIAK